MYVARRKAAEHYGVSKQTIAAWAGDGKLQFVRLPSGQRRYYIGNVGRSQEAPGEKKKICYCRVSSQGQKEELRHQIEYMRRKYPGWEILSDVGSGLNWKRKNLRALLQRCMQGDVEAVAVAHRDRLARFGYDILDFILAQRGVKLVCDSDDDHKSKEQELVEDILSIVTVFSSKIYGQRKYKKNPEAEAATDQGSGNDPETVAGML